MNKPIRHANHDDPRIEKLPQWARAIISELKSESRNARRAMADLVDDQPEKPDYHKHEFYVRDSVNGEIFKRYFRTRDMNVEHLGMRVNITPRDRTLTLYFEAQSGYEVVVVPGAANCIRLAPIKTEPGLHS